MEGAREIIQELLKYEAERLVKMEKAKFRESRNNFVLSLHEEYSYDDPNDYIWGDN